MALKQLEVALLSGRSVTLFVEPDISMDDLKQLAERDLEVPRGILVSPAGTELFGQATLAECGLETGSTLGLHTRPLEVSELLLRNFYLNFPTA